MKCTGDCPSLRVDDVATFGQNLLARGPSCRITTCCAKLCKTNSSGGQCQLLLRKSVRTPQWSRADPSGTLQLAQAAEAVSADAKLPVWPQPPTEFIRFPRGFHQSHSGHKSNHLCRIRISNAGACPTLGISSWDSSRSCTVSAGPVLPGDNQIGDK